MINEIQRFLSWVTEGRHLSRIDAGRAFQIMMIGGATPAQIAALLTALKTKGESVGEITGAAEAMRVRMDTLPVTEEVMDVCGTGGDGTGMLNVSTAVALVVAACGIKIAKHGNKSVSSRSGSSDVLTALGINLLADKTLAERSLRETGFCYLHAPLYHKALRHIAPIRQELGMRTLFNLLGPLANPARPSLQLMGVYDTALLLPMAQTLQSLGSKRAWVVCGEDGADELTLTGTSYVTALAEDHIQRFCITPEDAGLVRCTPDALQGGSPEYNAKELSLLLAGKPSAYRDMVLLNAAAALLIAGKVEHLTEGVHVAARAIDEGQARAILTAVVHITNETRHE